MKFAFTFVLILIGAVSAQMRHQRSIEKRIAGGKSCGKDRQYHVKIQTVQGKRTCGGSLLNPRWVITASHCGGQQVKLEIGHATGITLLTKRKKFEIETSQQFSYKDDSGDHDIMLIKLNKGVSGSLPTIQLAPPGCTQPAKGDTVQIGGWGATKASPKAKSPWELKCTHTIITDCGENDKPGPTYFSDESTTMCGFEGGMEVCNGDAGSAVEYNNVLYGIILNSPVDKCDSTIVMANICHYREWIDKTMKENA